MKFFILGYRHRRPRSPPGPFGIHRRKANFEWNKGRCCPLRGFAALGTLLQVRTRCEIILFRLIDNLRLNCDTSQY